MINCAKDQGLIFQQENADVFFGTQQWFTILLYDKNVNWHFIPHLCAENLDRKL